MGKKRTAGPAAPLDRYFVKELAAETPPSFSTMAVLYGLASELYGLRPWRLLDESQLVLARDSQSGELCYCTIMGQLGEVYSMHTYIGAESFRLFRRVESGELTTAGEFLATQHAVSVEFVPRAELKRQDRELLAALGHPQAKGQASPIFRAIRPGFHPWFVTEQEATTLMECIRAVIEVCTAVVTRKQVKFWDKDDTFPLVSLVEGIEPHYQIELVEAIAPAEPPVTPVRLDEATLRPVRNQDYPVRGVMELDYAYTPAAIGDTHERKTFASAALAVDAETGLILGVDATDSRTAPGEGLARLFLKAIQANRALPKEVRLRNRNLKDQLAPLMESFGVTVRVAAKLPETDRALAHLLAMMRGGMMG
jgi:hypothetical protein